MSRGRKSFSSSITDNWEKVFFNSIGNYITLINKGLCITFKSEPLSNHIKIIGGFAFKNAEYKNAGIPIIRISDFNNERIVLDSVVYYEESPLLVKYELKESDIIIALTGGTIGKLGIVQAGLGKLYLNQRVGKFDILKPDEFEKEYIYWIARGIEGIVKKLAWGAAIPNVSPKQIEELNFPIPTKDIQGNIIRFLNDLKKGEINGEIYFDSEIENIIKEIQEKQVKVRNVQDELSYQLTQMENLNQAILQEAVKGKLVPQDLSDEPAKDLLKRIKAEKEQHGKKEKPLPPIKPEEIPFEIPESWVWCRLGDIAKHNSGKTLDSGRNTGELREYITTSNLYWGYFVLDELRRMPINLEDLEKCTAIKGDLLICEGGEAGRSAVWDNENSICIQNHIHRVRPYLDINSYYIFWYMKKIYKSGEIHLYRKGMGIKNLSGTALSSIIIPLPPLAEQKRIVTEIEKQLAKTKQLKEHIIVNQQATEQLLKALLNKAFEVEEL